MIGKLNNGKTRSILLYFSTGFKNIEPVHSKLKKLQLNKHYKKQQNKTSQKVSGGDDVQQLLEACEEEFLEIMALVGMASKPLHVRRLQKTLQVPLLRYCKIKCGVGKLCVQK